MTNLQDHIARYCIKRLPQRYALALATLAITLMWLSVFAAIFAALVLVAASLIDKPYLTIVYFLGGLVAAIAWIVYDHLKRKFL